MNTNRATNETESQSLLAGKRNGKATKAILTGKLICAYNSLKLQFGSSKIYEYS